MERSKRQRFLTFLTPGAGMWPGCGRTTWHSPPKKNSVSVPTSFPAPLKAWGRSLPCCFYLLQSSRATAWRSGISLACTARWGTDGGWMDLAPFSSLGESRGSDRGESMVPGWPQRMRVARHPSK